MNTPSTTLDRRQFLGTVSAAAGGLTLGFAMPDAAQAATLTAVNTWLTIGSDNSVKLTIGSSDMGQGSFSGLAQILAEDLMVNPNRVILLQGSPTMATPAPIGTAINTVGSSVTRTNYWKLRNAAAVAREMLITAAQMKAGIRDRSLFSVSDGVIRCAIMRSPIPYGDVAALAATLTPPASAALVPDSQLQSIGRTIQRTDIPEKVDGSAIYGLDVRLPNMLYGIVKHSPAFGGVLASTPTTPSGMTAVVPVKVWAGTARGAEAQGNVNAVVVIGPNTWDTWQAANRLSVTWAAPANAASLNDAQFIADGQALLTSAPAYVPGVPNPLGTCYTVERSTADANAAIASSPTVVDATYTLPYVAHATLEVLNCTVDYVPGVRCDVYAPTQSAKTALTVVLAITGMPASQVTIRTTHLGGGLGRKAEVDFISQAVQAAMALALTPGGPRPLKLMWPRSEDFTHDQYRPMAVIRARAGLDANNLITGWTYRNVSPSILTQRGSTLPATGDSQGSEGSQALPYSFGARLTEYVSHPSPIPVGFWRSVGASLNTFAVESMIDELAAAAGKDPYLFRRDRLTDPRWLAVLNTAASVSGWATAPAAGVARGIAIGTAFNSIVCEVVEISGVTTTGLQVRKVTAVIDCYVPVNPGSIESQIIGGIVHGMNATLYGRQKFVAGVGQVKNFNNSRMMRIGEMPAVQVIVMPPPTVVDPLVPLGGVGELGVPTFAPALANAYFKLTGTRVRTLPLFPNATMSD